MSRYYQIKILIGLIAAGVIEGFTYLIYPNFVRCRMSHSGELDNVPVMYLFLLGIAVISLMISVGIHKLKGTTIPLIFICIALIHTSDLLFSVKCSCALGG